MTISAATTRRESKALDANSTEQPAPRKVRIVSLFSGAGGLEIAACRTGRVEAIVSTDSNATFLSTLERNMPTHFPEVRHKAVVADARELTGDTLKSMLGSAPDIVMGGPPCDDYTRFGRRLGFSGDKGPLIFEFLRIIEELQPACFIFENVPNLVQQFRCVFEKFLTQCAAIAFHTQWMLLKASDYGAPTQRTRVFVVGWKSATSNQAFRFPAPTHSNPSTLELSIHTGVHLQPYRFVRDVLADLPDVKTAAAALFLNHTGRNHRAETVEHMKTIPIGKQIKQSFRYRAPWDGLTQSLTAGLDDSTKSHIHPYYHREMSVREYARLHMFPDTWFFSGTHHNGIKQVANSIPIPLGQAVLAAVVSCSLGIERTRDITGRPAHLP